MSTCRPAFRQGEAACGARRPQLGVSMRKGPPCLKGTRRAGVIDGPKVELFGSNSRRAESSGEHLGDNARARGGKVDEDGVYAVASDESAGFADNFLERRRCGVPGQAVFSDQKLL